MKLSSALLPALIALLSSATSQEGPASVQERPFMLSRDRELESMVQQAEEFLTRGRPEAAASLLGRIQRARPTEVVVPVDLDRSEGLLTRVRRILRQLPPQQALALEEAVRTDALPLLERGLARRDPDLLFETATHFLGTSYAARARDALARIALEEGRAADAGAWFRRSLQEDPSDAVAAAGLALARALQGLGLPALPGEFELLLGGRETSAAALARFLSELPALLSDPRPWPVFDGAGRFMAPPTPHMALTWDYPLNGPDDPLMDSVLFPVTDGAKVFLCPGPEALALDIFTGRQIWSYTVPQATRENAPRGRFFRLRSDERPATPAEGLAFAGTLVGKLFICPLEVGRIGTDSQFRSIRITTSLPVRRLHAFDAASGELLWRHYSAEGDALRQMGGGWDVAGPPLGAGEHIYVPTLDYGQTVSSYVSCFEATTGRLLWRTRLCSGQLQLNMFGNPTREYAASPLSLYEGMLYGATNLGVLFALEAHTGEVRWLGFYESSRPPDMQYHDHFRPQQRNLSPFAANPPLVLGETVLFAPTDSEAALALDRDDGSLKWSLPARPAVAGNSFEIRHILGALDGEIYCQGSGVLAVNPDRRRGRHLLGQAFRVVITPERLGTVGIQPFRLPRGGLARDSLYTINQFGGIRFWDLQGAAAPAMRASRDLGSRFFGREAIRVGNLLATPGVLLTTSNRLVSAFLSLEHIVARAEQELDEKREDPELFLTLASVLLHRDQPGDLERAEELLENARALPAAAGEAGARIASTLRRVLLARVGALLAQGETDSAEPIARRAVEVSRPGEGELEARLLLAGLLERAGKSAAWRGEITEILSKYEFESFKFEESEAVARVGPRLLVQLARAEPDDATGAARALGWWRRLLEGFSADLVQGRKVRELATEEIASLLERHGRELYAPWEERAAALLERAGKEGEVELLRRIVLFFPNSEASARALRLLVDQAARDGDLGTLLAELQQAGSGRHQPGLLHRLAEATLQAGNPWLSRALFERLAARYGQTRTDFGPQPGTTYSEAAARRAPAPPPPSDPRLTQVPTRRQRIQLNEGREGTPRLLRPVTWGDPSPEDPLLFVSGEWVWAAGPPQASDLPLLWQGPLPGALRTQFPVFRIGARLVLCCRSSIAVVDLADGTLTDEHELAPGSFPRNFLARDGLVVCAVEIGEGGAESLRIQVVEPITGAAWGDLTVHPGPGGQTHLVPGPRLLHVLSWREEGDGRQRVQARLEITDIDPVTLESVRRFPPGGNPLLPLDLPLSKSNCLATESHLVLPLLVQGRSVLRALPLQEGASDWELELPTGEQLIRLTAARGSRLALLAYRGRQGVLRILEAATGAELRQVLLGPQALLLHPADDGDPWSPPPGPLLLALSGSSPRARTLHICDVEQDTVQAVVLSGDGFTSGSPLAAPVLGPGLAALALRQRPEGAIVPGIEIYLVDTARGLLLGRHSGMGGSHATPEMIAAGRGLLVLGAGNVLGILEPEGR